VGRDVLQHRVGQLGVVHQSAGARHDVLDADRVPSDNGGVHDCRTLVLMKRGPSLHARTHVARAIL
jgi:hypothetical protein